MGRDTIGHHHISCFSGYAWAKNSYFKSNATETEGAIRGSNERMSELFILAVFLQHRVSGMPMRENAKPLCVAKMPNWQRVEKEPPRWIFSPSRSGMWQFTMTRLKRRPNDQ